MSDHRLCLHLVSDLAGLLVEVWPVVFKFPKAVLGHLCSCGGFFVCLFLFFLFFLLFLVLSYFLEAEVSKPHDFRNFLGLFSLLSLSRLRSVGGLWGEEKGNNH